MRGKSATVRVRRGGTFAIRQWPRTGRTTPGGHDAGATVAGLRVGVRRATGVAHGSRRTAASRDGAANGDRPRALLRCFLRRHGTSVALRTARVDHECVVLLRRPVMAGTSRRFRTPAGIASVLSGGGTLPLHSLRSGGTLTSGAARVVRSRHISRVRGGAGETAECPRRVHTRPRESPPPDGQTRAPVGLRRAYGQGSCLRRPARPPAPRASGLTGRRSGR